MGIAFTFLTWLSWRKWPDPLIDFGQQLYVPWRLSRGAILYHDVSYVYGCLSVCYHAVLFKIFGVSLNVLLVSNFLILIFLLLLVYRLFLKCSDVWTATTAGLALTVLAFSQLLDVGNYNYICPYSHEEFHGIVLAVVMMACLARWLEAGRKLPLVLAGGCLGLIFLTKPEVFVGAVAPFAVAVIVQWRRISIPELAKALLLAAVCAFVPLAGFYFGFRSEMNSTEAARAICGAWLPLLHSTGLQLPIYQRNTGLDAPWFHIGKALIEFGGLAVIVGLCAWRLTRKEVTSDEWQVTRKASASNPVTRHPSPVTFRVERVICFALAGGVSINYSWQNSGHCLPLLLLVAAILWWREWHQKSEIGNQKSEIGIMWLAFSFAMLAKLGFNPRLSHYGVFLAMPAFLSAIYLLLHLLPRFLEKVASDECQVTGKETAPAPDLSPVTRHLSPFRAAMLIFLLAGLTRLTIQSGLFYKDKDFTLGSGGDRIVSYNPKLDNPKSAPTGAAMASAAAWIEAHTAPTNTLAVLPEGVMLNYLTRRDNPTPYVVFAFEVWAFGEQNMLAAYEKNPPDYIVLVQRDSSEYGVPYFGRQKGYGFDVMQWVRRNYKPVELIGAEPLQSSAFGIKILKRLPPGMRVN
jgi:4-amino-4-deoxy-L-arabinose transferase-like glycosyltransferase